MQPSARSRTSARLKLPFMSAGISPLMIRRIVLDGIVRTSHGLSLTVLSEGVEEQWQVEESSELNCDLLQGYLFSLPLPAQEALERLSQQNA